MRNFFPIILIAVAVGLFFAFVQPQYQKVQEARAEESRFDEALENALELQRERDELSARYASFSAEDLNRLETFLPGSIHNVRLIIEFVVLTRKHQLIFQNVSVSGGDGPAGRDQAQASQNDFAQESVGADASAQAQDYNTVSMSFSVEGRYSDFLEFVDELERSLRLLDITSLTFSAENDTESSLPSDRYTFSISLNTYYLP